MVAIQLLGMGAGHCLKWRLDSCLTWCWTVDLYGGWTLCDMAAGCVVLVLEVLQLLEKGVVQLYHMGAVLL